MKFLTIFTVCCSAVLPLFTNASTPEIPTDISLESKPATIKVLIAKKMNSLILEAKGHYQIYNPATSLPIDSGILGKRDTLTLDDNGLRWGDLYAGMYQFRLVPVNSDSSILVNGIQYRGCIEIYPTQGQLNVINEVDIDSYLKSTLTDQFPQKVEIEAMKAIAIVARTEAYFLASKNASANWHIEADKAGYSGSSLTLKNLHVDRAVDETKNVIMTYENAPFAATWTQDSAGKTAPYSTIFRKNVPSTIGVQALPAKKDREQHRWIYTYSKDALASLFDLPKVKQVDLFVDHLSGKVYGVRLKSDNQSKDIDFFSFQKALGKENLPSNDFAVSQKNNSLVFTGYGMGHGVGLCLYSAAQMAKEGKKADKILAAFFPHAKLLIRDK